DRELRARYVFYLAQSHWDAGDFEAALLHYRRRATLGGWRDQVFLSLIYAARLEEQLGRSFDTIMATYTRAMAAGPNRAEALHGASRLCRSAERYAEAYALAQRGLTLVEPEDAVASESWIYEYGLLDEFALAAYWTGRDGEALEAWERLGGNRLLPVTERARILENARFARAKLCIPDDTRTL